ncbi:MAG: hypothetical protein V2B18_06080, partial [Pseudomonadota bacterium]
LKMEEVAKTPEYADRGSYLLGRVLLALGENEKAVPAFEKAVESEGSTDMWLKPYAAALAGTGKDAAVIEVLQRHLEVFPTDDEAVAWLIGAMVREGRKKEAHVRMKTLPKSCEFYGKRSQWFADSFRCPSRKEVMELRGHKGWLTAVAAFPRSQLFITAARDRSLKTWDARTGQEIKGVNLTGEPAALLRVSPDEKFVAIGAAKTGVPAKILHLETGRFVGNLLAHEGPVTALGFSPDGAYIITVEGNGTARLWDTENFKAAATYKVPPHNAADVVFPVDSSPVIFVAARDRVVKRVTPAEGITLAFDKDHSEIINTLQATPDGAKIITGGRDKEVFIWDGITGKKLVSSRVHQDHVVGVALSPNGNLAASYDARSGIKLWDTSTGTVVRTLFTGESDTTCLMFTGNGHCLLAGSRDTLVHVWDVRGRSMVPGFALAKIQSVTKQMMLENQFKTRLERGLKALKKNAFARAYEQIRRAQSVPGFERSETALDLIYKLKDYGRRTGLNGGWNRKTLETPSGVMSVCFSSSAINFMTAQADHVLRMWSAKTGECLKTYKGHTNLVAALSYAPNGREAVSGGDDRTLRLWDLNSGRNIGVFKGHTDSVSSVAYSPDGTTVASASWDGTVKLWALADATLLKTLKGHSDKVSAVAFVGGTDLILSAGFDGVARMWETASGRQLRELRGHKDRINALRVSACGEWFATGSMDGTVRIWDVRKGAAVRELDVDKTGVKTVAFSPDKNFLVTGGYDCTLRIWDVDAGKCLRDFKGHSREITDTQFATNGRFLISSSTDGVVMVWELDWDWELHDQRTVTIAPD